MGEANLSFSWSETGIGILDPSGAPSPKVFQVFPPPGGRGYICPAEEFCWLYQRTSLVYRTKFFSRANIPPPTGRYPGSTVPASRSLSPLFYYPLTFIPFRKNSPLMPPIRVVAKKVDDSIDFLFSSTVAVSSPCSRSRQMFCSAAQQKQGI